MVHWNHICTHACFDISDIPTSSDEMSEGHLEWIAISTVSRGNRIIRALRWQAHMPLHACINKHMFVGFSCVSDSSLGTCGVKNILIYLIHSILDVQMREETGHGPKSNLFGWLNSFIKVVKNRHLAGEGFQIKDVPQRALHYIHVFCCSDRILATWIILLSLAESCSAWSALLNISFAFNTAATEQQGWYTEF